ncbi:unnamed protein product, partial [Rangifer tarandus platyrhynchus]
MVENIPGGDTSGLDNTEARLSIAESCSHRAYRDFFSVVELCTRYGRGGSSVVWMAKCMTTGEIVAVKQIRRERGSTASALPVVNEVELAGRLFCPEGQPRFDSARWPGCDHIARFYGVTQGKNSLFLVQEFAGLPLSKLIRSIKGEFVDMRRVYRIAEKPYYTEMKRNPRILKRILRNVLEVLELLNHIGYVHADLKPDNILVKRSEDEGNCGDVKVIDFGCAFRHEEEGGTVMATPEYMPPEALSSSCGSSAERDEDGNDRHLPGGFFAGHA